MHTKFLAVFAVATGLCAWTGHARAQGSAETDRAALEAIYRATGGSGWTNSGNWLTSAPLREWYGVETNAQGRVMGLRLGGWDEAARESIGNGLVGSLPPEIGTLSALRRVEIGGNSGLTGLIPFQLSSLADLEVLNLQSNGLTGSIPAVLGRLANLEELLLGSNPLGGQVPRELDNLVRLRGLELRYTMLSSPLPESLVRLSNLSWLALEGSGLCVPATPAMQAWVAAVPDFGGVFCVGSETFSRVVTQPGLGVFDAVVAVADLDGDGRDDVVAATYQEYNAAREDRLTKLPLRVLVNLGDGRFRHAPELVDGTIDVRTAIVVG